MINCEKYIWLQFDWGLPKKGKEIEMKKRKKYRCKREREKGPERDCHRRRLLEREVCGRKVSQLLKNKTSFSQKRIKELLEFFKYSILGGLARTKSFCLKEVHFLIH